MNVRDVMKSFHIQDTLNTNVWEEDKTLNKNVRKIDIRIVRVASGTEPNTKDTLIRLIIRFNICGLFGYFNSSREGSLTML